MPDNKNITKKKWFVTPNKKRRDPNNKRDIRIKISLSEKDKNLLQGKADKAGLPLAEYIYWVVMGKELVVHDLQFSETLRRISSISNNLNQIANRMNLFSTKTGDKENLYGIINMLYDLMTEEFQHLKTDKEK